MKKVIFVFSSLFLFGAIFLLGVVDADEGEIVPGEPEWFAKYYDDFVRDENYLKNSGIDFDENFQFDVFERPFEKEEMLYRADFDIYKTSYAEDEDFYYFSIALNGSALGFDLTGVYGIEIDLDMDGDGDFLILSRDDHKIAWNETMAVMFEDENDDVGSVNVEVGNGDGFETIIVAPDFDENDGVVWRRRNHDEDFQVDFALKKSFFDNQAFFYWRPWVVDDFDVAGKLYFHDWMGLAEAGSPNLESEGYPIKGFELVDSTIWIGFGIEEEYSRVKNSHFLLEDLTFDEGLRPNEPVWSDVWEDVVNDEIITWDGENYFEVDSELYDPTLDVVALWSAGDADFFYLSMEMNGVNEEGNLDGVYYVEIDVDLGGQPSYLIEIPSEDLTNDWKKSSLVFWDENNDRFDDVSDGFERTFVFGDSEESFVWVRRNPNDAKRLDVALRRIAFDLDDQLMWKGWGTSSRIAKDGVFANMPKIDWGDSAQDYLIEDSTCFFNVGFYGMNWFYSMCADGLDHQELAHDVVESENFPGEPDWFIYYDDAKSDSFFEKKRDGFEVNVLERPFDVGSLAYLPDFDIKDIISSDSVDESEFFYFFVGLNGGNEEGKLSGVYGVELDVDGDRRGDFLVLAKDNEDFEWHSEGVFLYEDVNDDVGGIVEVYPDDSSMGKDGFETVVIAESAGVWVRKSSKLPYALEFAVKKDLFNERPVDMIWKAWALTDYDLRFAFDFNDDTDFVPNDLGMTEDDAFIAPELMTMDSSCRFLMFNFTGGSYRGYCSQWED